MNRQNSFTWIATVALAVAFIVATFSLASCSQTDAAIKSTEVRLTNAEAYIRLLETTIDDLDDNMIDDAISGTDEYNNYYNN